MVSHMRLQRRFDKLIHFLPLLTARLRLLHFTLKFLPIYLLLLLLFEEHVGDDCIVDLGVGAQSDRLSILFLVLKFLDCRLNGDGEEALGTNHAYTPVR